jgi:glycosyltransferase involved in cell wall biosynthesis
VRHLVELLSSPGYREDELVFYGDETILSRDLLDDLSLAEVLVTEAAQSWPSSATRHFRALPNGARCRVLVRKLPDHFGYKAGLVLDQAALPFYAWLDGLDLMHSVANFGAVFSNCRQAVTVHDLYQAYPPVLKLPGEKGKQPKGKVTSQQRFFRFLFSLQFRRLQHILTDTSEVAKEICQRYRFDRASMDVVSLGLDPTFVQYLEHRKTGAHKALMEDWLEMYSLEPGFVLLIGSFDRRKNLDCQIEAWKALPADLKRRKLVVLSSDNRLKKHVRRLIGNEPLVERKEEPPALENGEKPGRADTVADFVEYLPDIDRTEMPFLFDAAGVLLNATLAEGFGLPAHEALAVGSKIVTSPLESLRGIVSDNIYECDPNDQKSVANALKMALGISLLDQSVAKASSSADSAAGRDAKIKWRTMMDCVVDTFEVYRLVALRYGN